MTTDTKLAETIAHLGTINLEDFKDDNAGRLRLVEAAQSLLARISTPVERTWQLAVTDLTVHAARQTVTDLGLWEGWAESGITEASLEDLVGFCKTSCDHTLLQRLLRLLVAEHYIDEIGEDRYRATPMSLALGDVQNPTRYILSYLDSPIASNLPKFLAKTGYENPTDPTKSNFMAADPDGLKFFQRMGASPETQLAFVKGMEGLVEVKPDWTEIYDTELLLRDFDSGKDGALLVELGGSHGRDISRLLDRHPELPAGSLVLQDLPDVLEFAKPHEKITVLPHDFFKPQPIRHARAYFIHACLHDWDDIDCRRILKQIVAVMKPGYSKLLLYETVIPRTNASTYQAMADVTTMCMLSAAERTEAKWAWLLAGADLKIVKIWSDPSSPESVIEATLATS